MRTLIVGAGATGGYLGAKLVAAGRDVKFLAHRRTQERLQERGVEILTMEGIKTQTPVHAVSSEMLSGIYDVVIVAVRSNAMSAAVQDVANAVGPTSTVIPIGNGVRHLDELIAEFGSERVCGGVAQMVTSLQDGVILELRRGADIQIGRIDDVSVAGLAELVAHLTVPDIRTTARADILSVMWSKFAFITATAVLTCLVRSTVGAIIQTKGGTDVALAVLAEVDAVLTAEGHALDEDSRTGLRTALTDPHSTFGPSMYRDLAAGRRVESSVLGEFTTFARAAGISTPLLDAALVAVTVHNARVTAAG